ncbi:hypothetical protein PGTUg99_028730 [Puccinia graminis f. sp. tritici]|uniref:Uncharacterized protein n=1 Tax=Puccinia graminis f. sp. tritici TaxID=56615 RepID=A0A5B0R9X0_PUCGR|nr:hypothetical protein PGTUg99_028730 [Puccinia graminis f. sp. tritici]
MAWRTPIRTPGADWRAGLHAKEVWRAASHANLLQGSWPAVGVQACTPNFREAEVTPPGGTPPGERCTVQRKETLPLDEVIPEDLLVIPRGVEGESDRHNEEDESPQDDGSEERVKETLPSTPDDQLQKGSLDQQQQHLSPNPIVNLLLRASDNPAILDSLVDKPDLENGHVELSTA